MLDDTRYVIVSGGKVFVKNLPANQIQIIATGATKTLWMHGKSYPIYDDGEGTKIEGSEVDFDKAARIKPNPEWTDDDRSLWK